MNILKRAALVLLAIAPIFVVVSAGSLAAQDVTEVDGTPDFRSPPFLGNGTFSDTIVAGEAVWYAVIYTNDAPYQIEVDVPGVDLDSNDDLELETSFISPTLGAAQTGTTLLRGTAFLTGGGPETQAWFIKIALNTTGRLGVQYDVVFTIDGVEDTGIDSCLDDPGCTLDEDLAALDSELEQIRSSIDLIESAEAEGDDGGLEALQQEADRLQSELTSGESALASVEQRTQSAESETASSLEDIAAICAPEADCVEPPPLGSSTSTLGLVLGGLVLIAGVALLGLRFWKASQGAQ